MFGAAAAGSCGITGTYGVIRPGSLNTNPSPFLLHPWTEQKLSLTFGPDCPAGSQLCEVIIETYIFTETEWWSEWDVGSHEDLHLLASFTSDSGVRQLTNASHIRLPLHLTLSQTAVTLPSLLKTKH